MTTRRTTLLLVDDHPVVRAGLAALLAEVPGFAVVAEAGTVAGAVAAAARHRPDVVLLDVRLPDGSGVEACRAIRAAHPETRVLMLTSFADEEAVLASLLGGAAGYLLKEADPPRLVEAVKVVAAGGVLVDPAVAGPMLAWLRRCAAPPARAPGPGAGTGDLVAALTDQGRQILARLAAGATNREIGAALHLSEHTVKHYVSRILEKLQVRRRAEAAAWAAGPPTLSRR